MAIHESESEKRASSEPDSVEVVYVKDNVMIYPTQRSSEKLIGRLGVFKKGSSVFLTWMPYKAKRTGAADWLANVNLTERDRILYTIKAVCLSDVLAIRLHPRTRFWQCIIVFMSSGLTFPGLNFYNGGVREFLAALEQHISLVRSPNDANVYIVNDFQDPLQRSLSSLELLGVVSVANAPSTSLSPVPLDENSERTQNGSSSGWHLPNIHDPARHLSIQMVGKFSLVTKFAWEAASQFFRGTENSGANERKTHIPDISDIPADPIEFDKLTLVWGAPRENPLQSDEWVNFIDGEGRILNSMGLRKRIFYGGLENKLRKEVWKLLLGYHEYDSTYAEREHLASVKNSEYETLKRQWQSISPAQAKNFRKFRERKQLIDNDVVRTDRSVPFYEGEDNPNVTVLRDILLTYSFYNFDIGYSQGMSDFLSPILFVMKDETQSFWCFVKLMERLSPNFNHDRDGMNSQLLALSKLMELLDCPLHNYIKQNDGLDYVFCFRWVLLQFKREFEYENTMLLWDVLWTHYSSEHLHLYICVAILKRHRMKIMGEQMDDVTLWEFINELSGHIDLHEVLRDAEALCLCAGKEGEACIPPDTPPSFSVEKQDDEHG